MLKDPEASNRSQAAKMLGVWGGPENSRLLLDALKDSEFGVRWTALDALKAIRDPKTAKGLMEYVLARSDDRHKAIEALVAIGPAAEDAVISGLNHPDVFVRMDLCNALKVIGTSKSIPALRGFGRRPPGLDVMAAQQALMQIGARTGR